MKVVVCSSGGGGNFQSLVSSSKTYNSYEISRLVVDRDCGAIKLASTLNIQLSHLHSEYSLNDQLMVAFENIDLIVLAGFMPIIPEPVINFTKGKIINVHPSLLPLHGGYGMYGVRVQKSVLESNDKFAGCTVHQVSPQVDAGHVLAQSKIIIPSNIDPWTLGGIVHELERNILPLTVHLIATGKITLSI